jgi:hypothetical protein
MAIASFDAYIAASRRDYKIAKTAAITTVAAVPFAVHHALGYPGGSGTISAAATAVAAGGSSAGELVTNATANMGALPIQSVAGKTDYQLTRVFSGNTVAARHKLYDRLWQCSMLLTTLGTGTITAPPSYVGRLPNSDYSNTEIVLEFTTAVSATATTVTVTYTNELGVSGRTTGSSGTLSGFTLGRHFYMPLQAGDNGVQEIDSIVVGGTVATTGRVNVMVIRPVWFGRAASANTGETQPLDKVGAPLVYTSSCLQLEVSADSTSSGLPTIFAEITAT